MKHFALFYEYGPNALAERAPHRAAHLTHIAAYAERGDVVLGGAFADPVDGALIIFKSDSAAVADAFAHSDPYVVNNVAKSWRVREWTTVAGEGALTKVVLA